VTAAIIATIGYQGADLDALVRTLAAAGVTTLVDVRAVPWSRKPGFAKADLRRAIEAAGLVYVHLQALGNPEAGRRAAKQGRHADYRRLMQDQLDSPAGQAALAVAADLAQSGTICLLCYEGDPACCHRAIVAERLAIRLGAAVRHLSPASNPTSLPLFAEHR